MSFFSVPEAMLKHISEYTNINCLLDSCTTFSGVKAELYAIRLNTTQSRAYYHAHHRESYVKNKNGKYFLSDARCNDWDSMKLLHDCRRMKRPLQRIAIDNDRQLAFYRKLRDVRLDLSDVYVTRLNMTILSHIGHNIVSLVIALMMQEYLQYVPRLFSLSIMSNVNATDFRELLSLKRLSFHCLLDDIQFGSLDKLTVYRSTCLFQYLPETCEIKWLEIWCSYLGGISELLSRPIDRLCVHIFDANVLFRNEVGRYFPKSDKLRLFIYDEKLSRDTYHVSQLDNGYVMSSLI